MAGAAFRLNAGTPVPPVIVVDIIPKVLSGETNTNSELNLGVNPADPLQIVASAYLPEPMGGKMSVIFISRDGGESWSCRSTVPMKEVICDFTVRFGGLLYFAALHRGQTSEFEMVIGRSSELARKPLETLFQSQSWLDQPYVAAATINKRDGVFVGGAKLLKGRGIGTATIDRSLDGAGHSPNTSFVRIPIEFKPRAIDSSEIRPANSVDGEIVYAVFNRLTSEGAGTRVGDVVLVRDDHGGNSHPPFAALRDKSGTPGLAVVKHRTFAWDELLGRDRLGGDLAIAVDPQHPRIVYLVWGELLQAQPVLHVIRSDDGGSTWSIPLRTVINVKNPGLAVNANRTLAFLYQEVVASQSGEETWITNLELTKDDFKSVDTMTLSRFPVSEIEIHNGQPQLGDYLCLLAVRDDFYGIFPASNVPNDSRFDCGVTFQRCVDRKAGKLLGLDGKKVDPSIDPFFFRVTDN